MAARGRKKASATRRAKVRQAAKRGAATKRRASARGRAPFRPAFESQRAGANPKELLLFELQRARVAFMAAVQGLPPGGAMRPLAEGKWSPLEIVLHVGVRDRVRLDEFERVLAGQPASWMGADEDAMAEMNARHLAPLRGTSWDDALRLLQTSRERLMSALLEVPAEPAEVWTERHSFGAMMYALPQHDRHHAEQIRNARLAGA